MTDKSCLIIGGGRGMGGAAAREMAHRGYKLTLMSPSESCETLAAELGGVARRGVAEKAADLSAAVDLAMQSYGRIDAALLHVGGPPKGDLLDISDAEWEQANAMVVMPVIRLARLLTPIMQAQGGGSIVNITTAFTEEPSLIFPTSGVYRTGVSAFAKLYSDRYGPDNIRMNCLLPGFTDSLNVGKFADQAALKRIARAEEQGKAAAFLLTEDSSYMTGQSLRVDGGATRHI